MDRTLTGASGRRPAQVRPRSVRRTPAAPARCRDTPRRSANGANSTAPDEPTRPTADSSLSLHARSRPKKALHRARTENSLAPDLHAGAPHRNAHAAAKGTTCESPSRSKSRLVLASPAQLLAWGPSLPPFGFVTHAMPSDRAHPSHAVRACSRVQVPWRPRLDSQPTLHLRCTPIDATPCTPHLRDDTCAATPAPLGVAIGKTYAPWPASYLGSQRGSE